jgi:hypothetical protein
MEGAHNEPGLISVIFRQRCAPHSDVTGAESPSHKPSGSFRKSRRFPYSFTAGVIPLSLLTTIGGLTGNAGLQIPQKATGIIMINKKLYYN